MTIKPTVGHVTGTLTLQIADGAPVNLGTVRLPLIATRVSPEKAAYMNFGIGVDLESVKRDIEAIFSQHKSEPKTSKPPNKRGSVIVDARCFSSEDPVWAVCVGENSMGDGIYHAFHADGTSFRVSGFNINQWRPGTTVEAIETALYGMTTYRSTAGTRWYGP